jgi:hypothetical protein
LTVIFEARTSVMLVLCGDGFHNEFVCEVWKVFTLDCCNVQQVILPQVIKYGE